MSGAPQITIGIVGAGKVGIALAMLLSKQGHRVLLGSRDPEQKQMKLAEAGWNKGQVPVATIEEAVGGADLILFTVPDSAVRRTAEAVTEWCPSTAILAHCSGVLDSTVLLGDKGARRQACSLHPLNTFPSLSAAIQLGSNPQHGTTLVCEGHQPALEKLTPLFSVAGFRCVAIQPDAKPLYHAASVIVCNYLSVLMDSGLRTAELAGLDRDQFWLALQPLISATLENVTKPESLSGPIARGDVSTVITHIEHLSAHSDSITSIYQTLGRAAVALARSQGQIDHTRSRQLLAALDHDAPDTDAAS